SSPSFRTPSPLKGALLGDAPCRDRKLNGLARPRRNFGPRLPCLPKREGFLQRALRSREFRAGECCRARAPRKADSGECLFDVAVNRALGFNRIVQRRATKVVHTFDKLLSNDAAIRIGLVLQYNESAGRPDEKMRLGSHENAELCRRR